MDTKKALSSLPIEDLIEVGHRLLKEGEYATELESQALLRQTHQSDALLYEQQLSRQLGIKRHQGG